MGRKIISLRYAATCADCGASLEAGARARYYGRGKVYGLDCHGRGDEASGDGTGADMTEVRRIVAARAQRSAYERGDRSPGARASHYDRRGVYSADGTYMGTSGPRCEDAPCCGCCS